VRTILVIAGLDPSGGAGILADARVAAEHGARVAGVVTALTVQDTQGVRAVEPCSAEVLEDQLRTLLADVEVDAVKIGMLGDAQLARVIADALAATRAPVVWDPVRMPSRGAAALYHGPLDEAARLLLPEVRVVTPNLDEACALTDGAKIGDVPAMRRAAAAIRSGGASAVLVKGGHLGEGDAVDVLHDGDTITELSAPRVRTPPLHGTGCVLSTAIACGLATGGSLESSVRAAKDYLGKKLTALITPGRGARTLV
jgi:hydroxymethylpyrimidine/phosphomethylpyrimidine kinase